MKRKIIQDLLAWKRQSKRKPLLLMGARQVGKTFVLKKFGEMEYVNTVYLNFENNPKLCKLFDDSLEPKTILKVLSIEMESEIVEGKTLLIFDEVQECPNALNSLKYFCEEMPEQHIVAAGSLLGGILRGDDFFCFDRVKASGIEDCEEGNIDQYGPLRKLQSARAFTQVKTKEIIAPQYKLAHVKGFPVGKVEFLTLYPLSFLEFLGAIGQLKLKEFLEEYKTLERLPSSLHDKLIGHFKEYLFVGGMPEAVYEYAASQNVIKVRGIQMAVLSAYSLDFAKHAPTAHVMKINQVWSSIPSQLAKENKKFIYSAVREGGRAKEFEVALQWLFEAGLIYRVPFITVPKIPLSAYADINIFKIYLVDVGLLGAMSNLSAKTLLHGNELFQEFRGALTENYVAQELVQSGHSLFYWASEGRAEVDFVFTQDDQVYPLEITSGESSKKKSLKVYGDIYHPQKLIRASPMNLKQNGQILNCPLYLVEKIRELVL